MRGPCVTLCVVFGGSGVRSSLACARLALLRAVSEKTYAYIIRYIDLHFPLPSSIAPFLPT